LIDLKQIALHRGPKLLFEDASFQVHPGQRLGVVGANGSGKSSLFAMLTGELEPDSGELSIPAGLVLAQVRQESPRGASSALDYVMDGDREFRKIEAALKEAECRPGVPQELPALHERMEAIDGYSAEARAARLLNGLGFTSEAIGEPVRSFSGGWRMRLNLAQALMCRSDILLLDEPTNHLDLPAIPWLEQQLTSHPGILLVISHDRDFLDGVCTRIAHIEHCGIQLFSGNYSAFEQQRSAQLAQKQALYLRQQKDIAHLQSFVERFRYKASKARQAQSRVKMMERMTRIAPAHVDSPFRFQFMEPDKQPGHLLNLRQAVLGYESHAVLQGVDLSISAGDRFGLLGVNGAGKSTLVKALADGSTLLAGERVLHHDAKLGYFAQHQLDQLRPEESPMDHLREWAGDERESEQRSYLGRFGFGGDRVFEPVAPFSGGEKARLVLALMIRQRPNLLLLDEPTNHLDLEMRQALSIALMEYAGALVVISHDRHLLRSVCDELIIVHDGIADRFDRSLEDYPAWLRERQSTGAETTIGPGSGQRQSRKKLRREGARRRQSLQPLTDRLRRVERELSECRADLERIDQRLNEETLYSDPARRDELRDLSRQRAQRQERIETLEWDWLEASEALEQASS
jgi:ATP-binding cassette subfamily F protein 3